jgi:hypothetical protein
VLGTSFTQGSNTEADGGSPTVTLQVREIYPSYSGPGIVALDQDSAQSIGTLVDDVVELAGKQKALAKVVSLLPSDSKKGIARIDNDTRTIAGCGVGDMVTIYKLSDIPFASKVALMPLIPIPSVDETHFVGELDGTPLIDGSNITIQYMGARLPFKVAGVAVNNPQSKLKPAAAIVNRNTKFAIQV